MHDISDSMRLDKWLWCARFFKTRAMAAAAIKKHKVSVDDSHVKAAKNIKPKDRLTIRKPPYLFEITILKLSKTRLSANKASLLYEETPKSIQARTQIAKQMQIGHASFPKTHGRPSKRDRRHIIRFTRKNTNQTDNE